MASAPVRLPSGRSRGVSALLALAALLAGPGLAGADKEPGRALLLFPVQSHWLSEPLAEKVTPALREALAAAGFTVADPRAPSFGGTVATYQESPRARSVLAVTLRAQASLIGQLTESETTLTLSTDLQGSVSMRSLTREFKVSVGDSKDRAVVELARQAAAALTPEEWAAVGADPDGQKEAAAQRLADGRKAMGQQASVAGPVKQFDLEAADDFEAAVFGDPDNADYLVAAAEAQVALGNYDSALVRLRAASGLRPNDISILLRQGDVALLAGRPEQAEAAFLGAQALDYQDPRALEGLARSARARGQFERSRDLYAQLLPLVGVDYREPSVQEGVGDTATGPVMVTIPVPGCNESLPRLLAGAPDDTVRLAGTPEDELPRELGLLYLSAGETAEGVAHLLAYHQQPDRPPYTEEQYAVASAGMDAEAEAVAREMQTTLSARDLKETTDDEAENRLKALHDRSDDLATVAERMKAPGESEQPHRYRALAYILLNQSDFEAVLYVQTGDSDRLRRAEFWRKAYREALSQVQEMETPAESGPEAPAGLGYARP